MTITERLTTALAGRYRLERHLGEGGMATVYLAEDLKHKRKVALKVLRPELAAILGAERFLKEIELTANLQHPNILPLYDSGEADTFLYYVMPFVEGESLRDRLNQERQLGVDEAIEITKSVAAALQYAHERKVVHRDIKPENILLQSGQALVADFGIALAVSQAGGTRLTQTGLSLGTPAYMSPEQATGDRVLDARSDIYSLGCMTYEMLVGEPPHVGNSVQAIIAKILSERPHPVSQTRDLVPPNVDAAVQKALAKSPADRFRTAAEYSAALTNATFTVPAAVGGTATVAPQSRAANRTTMTLVAVSLLAISAAGWGWLRPRPTSPVQVTRLSFTLPDSAPLQQQFGTLFALTEDGSSIVYVGPGENDIDLWTRPLNSLTATRIPGSEGGDSPFLSPDGSTVAFYRASPNALFSVSLRGGPRETLVTDSMVALGGDFGPDGSIYFVRTGGLRRRLAAGTTVEEVTRLDSARGDLSHAWPDVLPDGNAVLFTIERSRADQHDIAVVDLRTREVTILFRGVFGRYSPTGHIVYAAADGGLFAIGFDTKTLVTRGSVIPVAAGVVVAERGIAHFALSGTGSLLYGTGGATSSQQLERLDRTGRAQVVDSAVRGSITEMAVSPDGTRLAFAMRDNSGYHIWVKDLNGGPTVKVSTDGLNYSPAWHPNGGSISFLTSASPLTQFRMRRADGSGPYDSLPSMNRPLGQAFLSRDGEWAVYQTDLTGGRSRDLYARRLRGDTATVTLAETPVGDAAPRLSPDSKWLAYASNESGQMEVYVSPFPNTAASRTQVSLEGGVEPLWSPTGRELFYSAGTALVLTAARVQLAPGFRVLDRTTLFSRAPFTRSVPDGPMYGVSPDGQHFYMTRMRGTSSEQLVLVLNWFEELRGATRR